MPWEIRKRRFTSTWCSHGVVQSSNLVEPPNVVAAFSDHLSNSSSVQPPN